MGPDLPAATDTEEAVRSLSVATDTQGDVRSLSVATDTQGDVRSLSPTINLEQVQNPRLTAWTCCSDMLMKGYFYGLKEN